MGTDFFVGLAPFIAAALLTTPPPESVQTVTVSGPRTTRAEAITTRYAGDCRVGGGEVLITSGVASPTVTVRYGGSERVFDANERFARDLFLGSRYSFVEILCVDDDLQLLVLSHAWMEGRLIYLVGAVTFSPELEVLRYDGLGEDNPQAARQLDLSEVITGYDSR